MTPNRAKIAITNPCSQNWDEMKADSIGRFCQSCQKSVIDFTSKTDEEIKLFLKDKQKEQVCGRFYNHQVNRIRIEIDQNILISNIPFWQKFLVVFLVCFGADFLGYDFVFAQTETDSISVQTEQLDSLVSLPAAEADSTLEVLELTVDSFPKPIEFKCSEIEWIILGSIMDIPETMGLISIGDEGSFYPEWDISLPFELKEDTIEAKTGIAQDFKTYPPVAPKRPRKKPTPAENAIIASVDDRRKTRRS